VNGALSGLRVLDFTWVVGGPLCTKYLAMLGAEVVKVESSTRREHRKRDGQFDLLNAGKLSCEADLKTPEGLELVRRLIGESDIIVENYGVGVMRRLGLDYATLRASEESVIMLSLSGMGQEGPDNHLLAYGSLIQSYAGWTSLLCAEDDLADDRMGMVPVWADHLAGLMSTFAILAAVHRRAETGQGDYLDVSILESVLSMMPAQVLAASAGADPVPLGNSSPRFAPHGVYPCAGEDRWIAIAAYTTEQWERLRDLAGLPSAGFDSAAERLGRAAELDSMLAAWTRPRDPWQLEELLRAIGVPAAVSRNLDDLLADQHLAARHFFRSDGKHPALGLPWVSPSNPPATPPAPALGEHTARFTGSGS
jgi:benzylsuccinate CoA-transferase BbsF subunit